MRESEKMWEVLNKENLEEQLKAKDDIINDFKTFVLEKDRRLEELKEEIREGNQEISQQAKTIQDKEAHIQNIESERSSIKQSRAWRLAELFRHWFYVKLLGNFRSTGNDFKYLFKTILTGLNFNKDRGQSKLELPNEEFQAQRDELAEMVYSPKISLILPVYNPCPGHLTECIESVIHQNYSNWELCVADDASTDFRVKEVLYKFAREFPQKIKVVFREKNGHICVASNSALELATGDFVAELDHDDLLAPGALHAVAALLNQKPDADMIYSDENKVDGAGNFTEPFYKPRWAPEMLMGQMYTCHFGVYRRSLVKKLGGYRMGYEGSQDYDLVLRISEKSDRIYHIPHVLYHWRKSDLSTSQNPDSKSYAFNAGLKAVNDALRKAQEGGWAEQIDRMPGCNLVHYAARGNPLISIIILTRDESRLLDRCLFSIYTKTDTSNYEIILIDNGSQKRETFDVFEKWKRILSHRLIIKRVDAPFNYSMLNNRAVDFANGKVILLLNNDTEVLTLMWLEEMAGYAQRKKIGAVGAFLTYPDDTIQHAGIVLGITGNPGNRGVAGNSHKYMPAESAGYFRRLKIVSNYSAVTAACLMVEKSIFEEVGGLDVELGVAFNDVDFCLKILKNGYRNVVLPQVRLIHHESKSRGYEDTPEKLERFARETRIMIDRWGPLLENDPYYNPNLTLWKEDFSVISEKERQYRSM